MGAGILRSMHLVGYRLGFLRGVLLIGTTALAGCGDDSSTGPEGTATTGSTDPTTTASTPTTTGMPDTTGDETDTSTGTSADPTGGADETTTAEAVCPATHQCIEEPPDEWNGPIARFVTDPEAKEQPSCDGAYPEEATVAFEGLQADPAECSCSCGEAQEVSCENQVSVRYFADDETCSGGASADLTLIAGICNTLPLTFPGNSHWLPEPIEVQGGACEAIDEMNKEDPSFESRILACGGAELLGGCAAGRLCAPRPEGDQRPGLCVWQAGEHECPGGYDERTVVWGGADDQRGCAPCGCGDPVGLCDEALIRLFQASCTGSLAAAFAADGECHSQSYLSTQSATVTLGDPVAFCSPTEPMAVGEVVGTDPVTVCCTQ